MDYEKTDLYKNSCKTTDYLLKYNKITLKYQKQYNYHLILNSWFYIEDKKLILKDDEFLENIVETLPLNGYVLKLQMI